MFRTFLLAAICCIATAAQAEQITTYTASKTAKEHERLRVKEDRGQFDLALKFRGGNNFDWNIPALDQTDAGTVFTLDPTTASSYGVDWEGVEDYFENTKLVRSFVELHQLNATDTWSPTQGLIPPNQILGIDISFSTAPFVTGQYWVTPTLSYRIFGTLPEPSSAVLVLIGFCCASNRRHRRESIG